MTRLRAPNIRLLDAGCGTGEFLDWALSHADIANACGLDVSPEAIDLAKVRAPGANLMVASLSRLPFEDQAFDLVTAADVIQHVPGAELTRSLLELRRVLSPGGALLIRTNCARRPKRYREDWCVFSPKDLSDRLGIAGFGTIRLTHANVVGSAIANLRGKGPRPPTHTTDGIPSKRPAITNFINRKLLLLEASFLARTKTALPYGSTLFALVEPAPGFTEPRLSDS